MSDRQVDSLLANFQAFDIATLSDKSKQSYTRIAKKVYKYLPQQDKHGDLNIRASSEGLAGALKLINEAKQTAYGNNEQKLLDALEPIENMLRKLAEAWAIFDEFEGAYEVFKRKLDGM